MARESHADKTRKKAKGHEWSKILAFPFPCHVLLRSVLPRSFSPVACLVGRVGGCAPAVPAASADIHAEGCAGRGAGGLPAGGRATAAHPGLVCSAEHLAQALANFF